MYRATPEFPPDPFGQSGQGLLMDRIQEASRGEIRRDGGRKVLLVTKVGRQQKRYPSSRPVVFDMSYRCSSTSSGG